MLLIVALLILAVLLFGSSAVLGAIGAVLGFVALVIALGLVMIAFPSLQDTQTLLKVVVGLAFAVGVGGIWANARDGRTPRKPGDDKRDL